VNRTKTTMSDDDRNVGGGNRGNTGVVIKPKMKTKKPSMYKVIMLNDDYTPMEFVVHVLERFFSKNREQATQIMLHVHQRGVGVCGTFTYEVAETKVSGDGLRASESAPPSMHRRKGVGPCFQRTSRKAYTERWITPTKGGTNTPRWSICSSP